MPKVTYVSSDGKSVACDVQDGENVMRGALEHEVEGIIGECGGGLACATCHCYVDETWAEKAGTPTSRDERDMLEMAAGELRPTSRLSCQIEMSAELDGLIVHLPAVQY